MARLISVLAGLGLAVVGLTPAVAEEDTRYSTILQSPGPASSRGFLRAYLPPEQPAVVAPSLAVPLSSGEGSSAGGSRRSDSGFNGGGPASICVRMCDGFYFPAVNVERTARENLCQANCPDAEVVLFEGGSVEDARDRGGRRYADLAVAYRYRQERVNACTCRTDPSDLSKRLSVTLDPTLKAGDAVVTESSAVVFSGKASLPFRRKDFQPMETAALLGKGERSHLQALLGLTREQLLAKTGSPTGQPTARAGKSVVATDREDDLPSIVVTRGPRNATAPATPPIAGTIATGPRVVLPRPSDTWVPRL
ncbi:MAG: DUF2865 domain-containing protein [Alsobacter sp.]